MNERSIFNAIRLLQLFAQTPETAPDWLLEGQGWAFDQVAINRLRALR